LGEGGFGKVVLVRKKAPDGSGQHFAMKVMKKSHINNGGNMSYTV
jgi:hypothetical protein